MVEFQRIVNSFIGVVDEVGKQVENEKMKVILSTDSCVIPRSSGGLGVTWF